MCLSRIAVTVFALALSGCSTLQTATPDAPPSAPDGYVSVTFDHITYEDDAQLQQYIRAARVMEQVVNSQAFRDAVTRGPEAQRPISNGGEPETAACEEGASTYTWNVISGQCLDNRAVRNRLIADDWQLTVVVERTPLALWCGWPFVNEIGHRDGDRIVTKACKLGDMTDAELAGHLIHEYTHVLGFGHPYRDSPNRPYTVPYHVGNAAVLIAEGL